MSKQKMIITEDQVLIDTDFLFSMIRSEHGNWQQVENNIRALLSSAQEVETEEAAT